MPPTSPNPLRNKDVIMGINRTPQFHRSPSDLAKELRPRGVNLEFWRAALRPQRQYPEKTSHERKRSAGPEPF